MYNFASMSADAEQTTHVTRLLRELRTGSPDAEARLFELIYHELRRMAAARMKAERVDHTLSPTAVVNEAYLRLSGMTDSIEGRTHFFAVAARAMRQILVDHARARRAAKRGGAVSTVAANVDLAAPQSDEELLQVDDALRRLAEVSPRQAQVVELRYFAGLTEEEVAEALGVTRRTINRDWAMARAWLFGQLKNE